MEDAERMGLPPEIAEQLADAKPKGFEVWPENMGIVDAWLIICSQWRASAMPNGQLLYHGLDYASAQAGLAMAGVTLAPGDWSGVRLMERVASAALNGIRG